MKIRLVNQFGEEFSVFERWREFYNNLPNNLITHKHSRIHIINIIELDFFSQSKLGIPKPLNLGTELFFTQYNLIHISYTNLMNQRALR